MSITYDFLVDSGIGKTETKIKGCSTWVACQELQEIHILVLKL